MTTAARLLRESDAPLREVATRIGYTSEFTFANAFKGQEVRLRRTVPPNGQIID
jgi:AraC-like DNA-binding protein